MLETAIFYVFAAALLVSAAAIITARNPVRAVLCMGLCFFKEAGVPFTSVVAKALTPYEEIIAAAKKPKGGKLPSARDMP